MRYLGFVNQVTLLGHIKCWCDLFYETCYLIWPSSSANKAGQPIWTCGTVQEEPSRWRGWTNVKFDSERQVLAIRTTAATEGVDWEIQHPAKELLERSELKERFTGQLKRKKLAPNATLALPRQGNAVKLSFRQTGPSRIVPPVTAGPLRITL